VLVEKVFNEIVQEPELKFLTLTYKYCHGDLSRWNHPDVINQVEANMGFNEVAHQLLVSKHEWV
jgi:hypothetical protein